MRSLSQEPVVTGQATGKRLESFSVPSRCGIKCRHMNSDTAALICGLCQGSTLGWARPWHIAGGALSKFIGLVHQQRKSVDALACKACGARDAEVSPFLLNSDCSFKL